MPRGLAFSMNNLILGAVLLALVGSAAGPVLTPFNGAFDRDATLGFSAGASLAGSQGSTFDVLRIGRDSEVTLTSADALVTLPSAEPSSYLLGTDASSLTRGPLRVQNVTVTVNRATSESRWQGMLDAHGWGLGLNRASTCSVHAWVPPRVEGANLSIDAPVGVKVNGARVDASADGGLVEATCYLRDFALANATSLALYDTGLRIRGHAAQGPVDINVTTGYESNEFVSSWSARQHVGRVVIIDRVPGGPPFQIVQGGVRGAGATVSVLAPALTVQGLVKIPSSTGSTTWGSWRAKGTLPALEPQGIFVVARNPQGITVQGLTTNAPSVGKSSIQTVAVVITVGALAAGLGVVLTRRAMRPESAALLLFTRVAPDKVLAHETRRLIVDLVEQRGSVGLRGLAREIGRSRTTAAYHVGVLRRAGLVQVARVGRRARIFSPSAGGLVAAERARLLQDPVNQRLLRTLRRTPRASQAELARSVGISQPMVSRRLRRLTELCAIARGADS